MKRGISITPGGWWVASRTYVERLGRPSTSTLEEAFESLVEVGQQRVSSQFDLRRDRTIP
jgi:hypothetical protein